MSAGRGWRLVLPLVVALAVLGSCRSSGGDHTAAGDTTLTTQTTVRDTDPATSAPAYDNANPPPAPAGATFSLDPVNPTADAETTATATGCPEGDEIRFGVLGEPGATGSEIGTGNPTAKSTSSTGPTSYRFPFPAHVVGPVTVQAVCMDLSTGYVAFVYPAVPAAVSTSRHLSVKPTTTVAAGSTLTVTPLGPDCPYQTGVEVTLELADPAQSIKGETTHGDAPHWKATLA